MYYFFVEDVIVVAPDDLNNSGYYAQYPGNKTLFKVDENSLRNTT